MKYSGQHFTLPTNSEYVVPQLRMLIRQAENLTGQRIAPDDPDEWNAL